MTSSPNDQDTPDPKPPEQPFLLRIFPVVVRYTGLAIALYETLVENVDRPALLALSGTMMTGSLLAEALIGRTK